MIFALVLLMIVFLLPLLLGRLGIFFDDYYGLFPRHYFSAQSLQGGSLPLWDPSTFAGGRLNYLPQSRMWYWPLYPFFLLAPLGNVDAAYAWLIKAPLLIHWIVCLLTTYGLGRKIILLGRPGAVIMALVYAFGAGMAGNISDTQTMYTVAWLPLVLWGIIAWGLGGSKAMGVLGSLAAAFIGASGSDPRAVFSLLTAALTVLLLAALLFISRSRKKASALLRAALLVFVFGVLFSAPYWTGMIEAVSLYRGSDVLDFSRVASPSSSTPPGYLATLLVPDLFATLTNARQIDIGIPRISTYWHIEGNLTGGYWLLLLCLLGVFYRRKRDLPGDQGAARRWWLIGALLFLLSLFLVTGCYSPVYRLLFRFIPVIGLPYAVRWRVMEHLGIAIMAGVSTHFLWVSRRSLPGPVLLFLAPALWLVVWWQWSQPTVYGGSAGMYLWNNHRAWLLRGPLPYLALATGGTAALWLWRRKGAAKKVLISLVGLEAITIGFLMTYFLIYRFPEMGNRRYKNPSETLYFRQSDHNFLTNLPPPRTGPERTVFYNSVVDQMATLHGGDYLTGLYSKPLEERFRIALGEVAEGYPYEITPTRPAAGFFPNMSVRYMVLEENDAIPESRAEKEPLPGSAGLFAYRLKETMPRVYTQNRVFVSSPEEALRELLNGDLRKGVFVEDGNQAVKESNRLSVTGNRSAGAGESPRSADHRLLVTDYQSLRPESEAETVERFSELQLLNAIESVRFPTPNRMVIEIEVREPALLVTADVFHPDWQVSVDGLPAVPFRVNYLQRGVWLPAGRHVVEWRFRPVVVRWGLVCAGIAGLGAILYLTRTRKKRRI